MGYYSIAQYEAYVKEHGGAELKELLQPAGELFDTNYPNIFIRYVSLPAWMDISDIVALEKTASYYKHLRQAYQRDKDDYTLQVKSRLNQIKVRHTGLALLAEIRATKHRLDIEPYRSPDGYEINATTKTATQAEEVNGTARGVPVNYRARTLRIRRIGIGGGANALVNFSPDMWKGSLMAVPSNAPDEILFHEMIHASRLMRGVFDQKPVSGGYVDQEEYLAHVLTNIYLSDKGQWIFTASHLEDIDDWNEIEPVRPANKVLTGSDADNFLKNVQHVNLPPKQLMEKFRWSQPDFYRALARLPKGQPRYNWVKEYYDTNKGSFTF